MPRLADIVRDSPLAQRMFSARYGERDPYVLAIREAKDLGYPIPGASNDIGEAQRYESSKLAAERYGLLPLLTNPLHEAALSWFAEGEGRPSLDRIAAGYRGTLDAIRRQASPEANRNTPSFSLASLLAAAGVR